MCELMRSSKLDSSVRVKILKESRKDSNKTLSLINSLFRFTLY